MPALLPFTPEVARETDPIYERVRKVIPRFEWEMKAPLIAAINRLKRERRAIVLGHNYQVPEIFHGISDFTGDSLELARRADTLLWCGCKVGQNTSHNWLLPLPHQATILSYGPRKRSHSQSAWPTQGPWRN